MVAKKKMHKKRGLCTLRESFYFNIFLSFRNDRKLVDKYKPKGAEGPNQLSESKLPTQQFGASLEWIKNQNNNQMIPPIMNVCMDFLSKPENLEVEGIFR